MSAKSRTFVSEINPIVNINSKQDSMDIKEYLKQNYISIVVNDSVSEDAWGEYAEICKHCKTRREVDEMVMFQDYYKVNLPIIRRDFANI